MSSFTMAVDEASPLLGEERMSSRPTRRRISLAVPCLVWIFLCTSCLTALNTFRQRSSRADNLWDDDGGPSTSVACATMDPAIYEATCVSHDGLYTSIDAVMIKTSDAVEATTEYFSLSKAPRVLASDPNVPFAYGTISHVNGWGDACNGKAVSYSYDESRNIWTSSGDTVEAYEWIAQDNAAYLHVAGGDFTCTLFRTSGEKCRKQVEDFMDSFPQTDEVRLDMKHSWDMCGRDS